MTRRLETESDGGALTAKAAALLAEAGALAGSLHLPGVRDDYRARLEEVVRLAGTALESAVASQEVALLRWLLVQAQAARAEDARYGAGQLARGSQRAPTWEDCEDGWQRVAAIVGTAEAAAAALTAWRSGKPVLT